MKGFKPFGGSMKSGHSFPSSHGFSGSAGKSHISSHMRSPIKKASGGQVEPQTMPPKLPKQEAPKGNVNFSDYRKGGKVHSDEAMDKKLIASELKKRGLKRGGRTGC